MIYFHGMHKYFITENKPLTATTLLLTLKKDPADKPFSFQPGQYAAISFRRNGRPTPARCFSIVSSPTEQDILQFSTRSKGHFTKALNSLKAGDEVEVRGSFGAFVFDAQRDQDTILLAGGIGITPFMSMIRFATDINLNNNITLLYSCQNQDDVPFANELLELEARNPHFKTFFIISQGPTDKFAGLQVNTGRISPEVLDQIVISGYASKTVFICGPPAFMRSMAKLSQDKGVASNRIITEAFSQGPNRQTGKLYSWPFNIYVLGAMSVVLSSFVVMVSDLLKTLPPSSFIGSSSVINSTKLTNKRQTDLDMLVNELPDIASTAPATDAVNKALEAANAKPVTTSTTTSILTKTTAPSNSTPTTINTSPPTKTITPKQTPAQTPKCTTTQSGVTTCI